MSNCQVCQAKSITFLCRDHSTRLLTMLAELVGTETNGKQSAGWLENLSDAIVGQVQMNDPGGGRRGQRARDLDGDAGVSALCDVESCRPQQLCKGCMAIRHKFLAAGRVNAKASELMSNVQGTLARIVLDLCESRGVKYKPVRFVRDTFTGPLELGTLRGLRYADNGAHLAWWLLVYVDAIVASEDAGMFYEEIRRVVDAIQSLVDLPIRKIWLGDCPTWNENRQTICGETLWAPEDAIEIICRQCRRPHNCNRLRLLQFSDLERTKVPWEKILRANKSQPPDRQVPERTLQSWRNSQNGRPPRLPIRGYRRPSGRVGNSRHTEEDVPLYLWPDIRRLRDERPQKKPTGASAHR